MKRKINVKSRKTKRGGDTFIPQDETEVEQSEKIFPLYARYSIYEKELIEFQKDYDNCCEQSGKNIKIKQYMFFSKIKCPKYNCDPNTSAIFNRINVLKNNIEKIKKFQEQVREQVRNENRAIMSVEDAVKTINSIKKSSTSFSVLDQELQEIWNNKKTKNEINNPSNVPNAPPKKGFFSSFTRKMPYSYFNPSPSSQLKKINPALDEKINARIKNSDFGVSPSPPIGVSPSPQNVGGKRTRHRYKNKNKSKRNYKKSNRKYSNLINKNK